MTHPSGTPFVRTIPLGQRGMDQAVVGVALDKGLGQVFVASNDYTHDAAVTTRIDAFDVCSDSLLYTYRLAGESTRLGVDETTSHLLVTFAGASDVTGKYYTGLGRLAVLDAVTGRVLHVTTLGHYPSTIAVDTQRRRAFICDDSGPLHLVDIDSGRIVRVVAASDAQGCKDVSVATATARAFAISPERGVSVMDARSGVVTLSRDYDLSYPIALAIDTPHRRAVVAIRTESSCGGVDLLDAATGLLVHTVSLAGDPVDLAVDERVGRAFVVSLDAAGHDAVPILSTTTGTVVKTVRIPPGSSSPRGDQAMALDAHNNHLFILFAGHRTDDTATFSNDKSKRGFTGPGHLVVLDARSGVVRRIMTLSHEPSGVIIDEQAARAFIVDSYDRTLSILDTTRL